MKPIEILEEELKSLEGEFLAKYLEKGMKASGDWGRSLENKVSSSSNGINGVLKANDYSQQLETGRKKGAYPDIDAIEKWIVDKGIGSNIEKKISVSSLAFLIARKIAREGWKREKYGGVDLISEVATPQRMQSIIDKVGQGYVVTITDEIIKAFKGISV
mgnify:CR=1 FL=1|jgi:hypothetical protein|tara:strand:- start:1045 stop:1524 length:480 start_codon:yes stop_codon:yes gene_type:complete